MIFWSLLSKKENYRYFKLGLFLFYFLTTTIIYILSYKINEGVALRLFNGGDDGLFYWEQVKNVFNNLDWVRTSIYPYIVGKFMQIINIQSVYIIRLINFIIFILLVNVSELILKFQLELEDFYKYRIYLIIYYFFYLSVNMQVNLSIYRDVWIYLLYNLSMLLSLNIIFNCKYRNIVLLFISVLLLWQFRKYAVLCFVVSLALFFLFIKVTDKKKLTCYFFLVATAYYFLFRSIKLPLVDLSLNDVIGYRKYTVDVLNGASQIGAVFDSDNLVSLIINYLYSFVSNLIGPLPWQINSFGTLVAFLFESIPMSFILYFVFKYRQKLSLVNKYIIVHSVVWVAMIALSNDNLGTATRLRVIAWNLIVIVYINLIALNNNNSIVVGGIK